MRITDIIWKEQIVEKLAGKHDVSIEEVEEVFLSNPFIRKIAKGHVRGEDLYAAMSHLDSGRRLIVFFIDKQHGIALPISARDMDASERKYYERHK